MLVIIGLDSQFTLIGETVHKRLSLLETETAPRLTRPLLVRRSDHHLHWRFLPWSLWNQTCFIHRHHMCCNLPPGFPLYYTGTALPVWVWSNDMTTDVMTLKMYLCVCVTGRNILDNTNRHLFFQLGAPHRGSGRGHRLHLHIWFI